MEKWSKVRRLGKGEYGDVLLVRNGGVEGAMKVMKDTPSNRREVGVQRMAAELGIAPKVYEDGSAGNGKVYVVMQVVKPFPKSPTRVQQRGFVKAALKAVRAGIIHNDLHAGNVGLGPKGNVLLLDYGLTELHAPIQDPMLWRQVLIAQLYAFADPCNVNNPAFHCTRGNGGGCGGYVVDAIYALRNGKALPK
jgi:hypothetical protein